MNRAATYMQTGDRPKKKADRSVGRPWFALTIFLDAPLIPKINYFDIKVQSVIGGEDNEVGTKVLFYATNGSSTKYQYQPGSSVHITRSAHK